MAVQQDVIDLAAKIDALSTELQGVTITKPTDLDLTPIQTSVDALKPIVDGLVAAAAPTA